MFSSSPQKKQKPSSLNQSTRIDPEQLYMNLDIKENVTWSAKTDPVLGTEVPAGTKLGLQIMCYVGKPSVKSADIAADLILPTVTHLISHIADHGNKLHHQVMHRFQ